MKYIETDFYDERVTFEDEGEVHSASLINSQDDGQRMSATFWYRGVEYRLKKWMELVPNQGTTLNITITKEV